ncbi:MAG: ABC transporter ATP-binding protein [Acidimicrobiales bacterium]
MPTAIEVRGLTRTYGATTAVDGISFAVDEGEVFAILGPNGAGKSTTVEILEGHRDRTGGDVSVLGVDPATGGRAFRDRIGIVLQEAGVDKEFTVREVLDLYGAAYSSRRPVDELIELVELADKADERISTLSGGQQRRVDLALGLVGRPDLVFLDEPTTGFDPAARRRSWDIVRNLASVGGTVVLTTHYMDEAEHLADRIAVMAGGRIVAEGTPAELRGHRVRHQDHVRAAERRRAPRLVARTAGREKSRAGPLDRDPHPRPDRRSGPHRHLGHDARDRARRTVRGIARPRGRVPAVGG